MKQYGFYFDSERCTGCKTCELACKDYKDLGTDVNFRRIYEYTGGTWNQQSDGCWHQDVFAYYMSISCNHCENPACTAVCPTGAMHKNEDGFVIVNEEICIGGQSELRKNHPVQCPHRLQSACRQFSRRHRRSENGRYPGREKLLRRRSARHLFAAALYPGGDRHPGFHPQSKAGWHHQYCGCHQY